MSNTLFTQQLRRLDEEILHYRQEIAVHRVRIAELEEARLTLQRLVDRDLRSGAAGSPSVGALQDLEVVVRQIAHPATMGPAGDEDGTASLIRKRGIDALIESHTPKRKAWKKKRRPGQHGFMRDGWAMRLLAYLKGLDEPASFSQIILHHGIRDDAERTRVRQTLGRLKSQGLIANPPGEKQGTGNRATYLITGTGSVAHANHRPPVNGEAHP